MNFDVNRSRVVFCIVHYNSVGSYLEAALWTPIWGEKRTGNKKVLKKRRVALMQEYYITASRPDCRDSLRCDHNIGHDNSWMIFIDRQFVFATVTLTATVQLQRNIQDFAQWSRQRKECERDELLITWLVGLFPVLWERFKPPKC